MIYYSKLITNSLIIVLLLSGKWCDSAPTSEKTATQNATSSYKNVLCSSEATPSLSDLCASVKGVDTDKNQFLRKIDNNTCEYAAYLAQKICEVVQSDKTMSTKTDLLPLISHSPLNDDNETFCFNMVNAHKALGYNTFDKFGVYECSPRCVNKTNGVYIVQPVCDFILSSWHFLANQTKTKQVQPVSETINSVGDVPPAAQKLTDLENARKIPAALEENVETNKAEASTKSMKSSSIEAKPAKQSTVDANTPPSDPGSEREENVLKTPGVSDKSPSSVKPEEENLSNDEVVDRGSEAADNEALGEPDPRPVPVNPQDVLSKIPKQESDRGLAQDQGQGQVQVQTQGQGQVQDLGQDQVQDQGQGQAQEQSQVQDEGQGQDEAQGETQGQGLGQVQGQEGKLEPPEPEDDMLGREGESEKVMNNVPGPGQANRATSLDDPEDSHVFVLFVVGSAICVLFYFVYLHKRKIIAMALEGKKGRHSGRRRPTSASYQKLDNKLDEVMASSPQPSKTHVIY